MNIFYSYIIKIYLILCKTMYLKKSRNLTDYHLREVKILKKIINT